ncbi:phage tail tape measure protein [Citricoccus sp.]|uniref:phage tail tape measure protein n=1 Tax=Citricoccus sp. TaxID=1978372 RepID=UPI0028BDCB51|nr:phage tail tape measure protein [Citricoccus sp.]
MEDATNATEAVISSISGMRDASEEDLAAMARSMSTVATVAGSDVGRAAQVAGQMVTNGLAKDGVAAADLLTAAMQKVPVAVRDEILEATDEYGPFFQQAGIEGEHMMSMLVKASEAGMYGIDKTGDAVKEFGNLMSTENKASVEVVEDLGLSMDTLASDMAVGGDKGAEAMQKVVGGLLDIKDPGEQAEAAIALFGAPIEDLSKSEIPAFLGQLSSAESGLGDVSGAAATAGEELTGGPATAVKEFGRIIQTSLMDVMVGVIPYLTPAIEMLSEFAPVIAPLALGLAAFAGAVWAVNGAMKAWAVVQTILNSALIKGAGTAVAAAFRTVGAWALMAASATVNGLRIAAVWTVQMVGAALRGAASFALSAARVVGSFVLMAVQSTVQAARVVASWVLMAAQAVVQGIRMAAVWTAQVVASAAVGATQFAVHVARVIASWVLMAGQAVVQGVRMAAVWTAQIVAAAASGAASFAVQAARVVGAWVLMGAQSLLQAARMAAAWFIALGPIGWVIAAVVGLVALIIANWDKVVSFTRTAFTNVANFLADTWSNITRGIGGFIDGAVGFFRDLPGNILSALGDLGGLLLDAGGQIIDGFLSGLTAGFDKVKGFIGGIGSWIADNKGPKAYDLALLVPAGGWIMSGLENSIRASIPSLANTLGDISGVIANGIDPTLAGGVTGAGVTAAGNPYTTQGTEGGGVRITVHVTEASNARETAQLVASKIGHQFSAQGVSIGDIDFD